MTTSRTDCSQWVGYKPCVPQQQGLVVECGHCAHYTPFKENILIIEAGGLGSMLRVSALTKELKRIYPASRIQWLTSFHGLELLLLIPSVDAGFCLANNSYIALETQQFDLLINFESSPEYLAIAAKLSARTKKGFVLNRFGLLDIADQDASRLLKLQTHDQYRKRENDASMQEILLGVAGIPWSGQSYDLARSSDGSIWAADVIRKDSQEPTAHYVGLNIGSSLRHKAKRWPIANFLQLIYVCQRRLADTRIVVLAGPEDEGAHKVIKEECYERGYVDVLFPGCHNNLKRFIALVDSMDVVVSADTFGLHVAIGLGKRTISLWGPQPYQETNHYGRGEKLSLHLECSPCFIGLPERCIHNNRGACMSDLSAQSVFEALERVLSE